MKLNYKYHRSKWLVVFLCSFLEDYMVELYFQAKLIGIAVWVVVLIIALIYQLWKLFR